VTFSVSATGSAPITYQWQFNGVNISNATGAAYTINNAQASNAGSYRVVVTNSAGSVTSNAATLTVNAGLRNAENPANPVNGLNYSYYEGVWSTLPDFNTLTPVKSGTANFPDLALRNRNDDFAFRFTGYVLAPADGIYTFYLSSDDGSSLQIGTTTVVNNDGLHAQQETSGKIGLRSGYHSITITFFEHLGTEILTSNWSGPNLAKQVIPANAFFRTGAQTNSWTFEAEQAYLSGPIVANNQTGYTGTGFADYQHATGDYIIWFGATPGSALYQLTFRYALATSAVNLNLNINGSTINSALNFPPTGSWTNWSTVSLNTVLNGGSNTIRLGVTGGGGPNLDHLMISTVSSSLASRETVAEESSGRRMMAYPNPSAGGKLYIDWTAEHTAPIEVELINFSGKVVKAVKFTDFQEGANTFSLDTEGMNNGVYWVRVKHGNESKASTVLISSK
jgi:hypothetical protein